MEDTSAFATVALPIALALIMGTLGLSLRPADFARIVSHPRGALIGLANLLVVSPLLAFAAAELYGLEAAFAVGLVLLGASPGGTLANLLTHLARGDTALSVTMTAISSVAAVVTVPLYLGLAIDHFGAGFAQDFDLAGVVVRVFLITIVPLSLGMWLRSRDPARVAAAEPRVKRVAMVVFVFVVAGAVASELDTILDNFAALALATLSLNVVAMTVSFLVARAARLDDRQATAISMELGIHNSTLAITVGASIADVVAVPAAVYSAFMFITAGSFARLMFRRNAAEPLAAPAPTG
ncbi:MAG TPA: bile acid:sodium symporter family protein [Solirubrobacteraceae bacterium]|nr:bile acid:sodium symporter family protein [Solirubrobacteraceae bacterium]